MRNEKPLAYWLKVDDEEAPTDVIGDLYIDKAEAEREAARLRKQYPNSTYEVVPLANMTTPLNADGLEAALTAYEMQVLIGTSISGCNIHTPDWTKMIDLSVMPPLVSPKEKA